MSGRRDGGLARRQPGEKGLGWAGLLGWAAELGGDGGAEVGWGGWYVCVGGGWEGGLTWSAFWLMEVLTLILRTSLMAQTEPSRRWTPLYTTPDTPAAPPSRGAMAGVGGEGRRASRADAMAGRGREGGDLCRAGWRGRSGSGC